MTTQTTTPENAMTTTLNYTGDLTCAFAVADRKKAIAWYTDVLGFELLYDAEDIGWCELKSPVANVTVGFSGVENPEVKGGAMGAGLSVLNLLFGTYWKLTHRLIG